MTQPSRRRLQLAALIIGVIGLPATASAFEQPDVQRGRQFAKTNCSMCHATGRTGISPMAEAPAFRTLSKRYPLEDLAEPLAEGIRTGHPSMPEWRLDAGQIDDLLAYMRSIQEGSQDNQER